MLRQFARYSRTHLNQTNYLISNQTRTKYGETLIDHYKNPRNVGSLDKGDKNVGSAIVGAPACGDVMKFQVQFDDNGRVVDAKFKTFGCGSAIASSSVATEWVKGKTAEECLSITNNDIAQHLALPPVKKHCSLLAESAIRESVSNYKAKQAPHMMKAEN
ncbi:iron-sulfur cluster assembly enzyme ISCU, mitochondrial [Acrasis kona]|uniref:Iron-sulfur cluster assembly protein n=1 Tax=Acrasis kona TaxID=1008807 RepID=A0AAW2YXE0_9EUKA